MNQDQIDSLVRSLLKVVGGILAAHGAVAVAGTLNSMNTIELVSGIVTTLIGFYASHTTNATQPVDTTAIKVEPKVTTETITTSTATAPLTPPLMTQLTPTSPAGTVLSNH